ncbi:MAG: acyltransferase [Desulfobulbaceae bacterium]|nr:acyltransferase [Desulfobulbaceae bacterium]
MMSSNPQLKNTDGRDFQPDAFPIMRFLAALIVVLAHFSTEFKGVELAPKILTAGSQMVTFFFVLSGFVLFLAYQDHRKIELRKYFIKRAIRVLPLYYGALLVMSGGIWLMSSMSLLSDTDIVLSMVFMQVWLPFQNCASVNFPGWFVSALLFFYGVFPLFSYLLKKTSPNVRMTVGCGCIFWFFTQAALIAVMNSNFYQQHYPFSRDFILHFPLSHLCSFVLGICGAYYLRGNLAKNRSVFYTLTLIMFVSVLIQFEENISETLGLKLPFGSSLYAPLFLLIIIHLHTSKNLIIRALSFKQFKFMGQLSYPMYIMQYPLFVIFAKFITIHMGTTPPAIQFAWFIVFLISMSAALFFAEKYALKMIRLNSPRSYPEPCLQTSQN